MNLTDGNHKSLVEPQPVFNEPALTVGNTLVLADLHIGIEQELSLKWHTYSITNRPTH